MTRDAVRAWRRAFHGCRLIVLGDVMLDRYIRGNVSRISPEAPVPILHVTREDAYPGGAANVARNLAPFVQSVAVLGVVGAGPLTDQLLGLVRDVAIDTSGLLVSPDHETTIKTRVIARGQQMARIDRESVKAPSPELTRIAIDWLNHRLPATDAIIIEDYAKGFVTQELVDEVTAMAAGRDIPLIVDPNPSNPLRWHNVTAVKPNRREAYAAAGLKDPGDVPEPEFLNSLERLGASLFSKWDTKMLLITLGEHGMALLERNQPPWHIPTRAREVFDVSGAGDTAIAFFSLMLAAGASPREAAELSNIASGLVVGKTGTACLAPEELEAACSDGR